ncbi:pleiotropic drug resistance protein 1-like isoform X1 [Mangifera indica]|uniref:pleiotropic drug resistance protein 1-like isoform X1 n=1 Tax=Mangifera indica TaxID=29780 RepID=UPI001CFA22E3|nr:pleiotropic drug resistance protein 1-like isoform X1 [Mangifera indica]
MERQDRHSLQATKSNGLSIWRDNGSMAVAAAFSNSFREKESDDEEALKWAALERLPTYSRLKKGLLMGTADGGSLEVDVSKLEARERKNLVDRLVRHTEEDNEKFLLKLRNRLDRVGIEIPTLEVRFENLNVDAEAHVGRRALPTYFNFFINNAEGFLNYLHLLPSRKKHLRILQDVTGIIKPCRMTLLLGPPTSGKTTLLLALAGKLDPDLKLSGNITYNGHEMNEFVPQRSAAYISQHDLHIPEMTVRETLSFSARCQGVGSRYDMLAELARREKAANIKPDPDLDVFMKAASTEGMKTNVVTDYIIKVLGLEICADTMVGDDMLRGISGGQRKRLTTGEMLVGPAKVLLMDEISTGLDSSTTFQIVNSLKQYVHILKGTALISLLQPAPETYDLFDDIILLSDGQIVYQGPREQVLAFFESMGFKCPERKGVADFLQEVTSRKDQQQYWACNDEPYSFVTVKEFSEAFQSFHLGKKLKTELETPLDKSKSHPSVLPTKKYGVKRRELLKACFAREILLMKRNAFVHILNLIQLIVTALIGSTIFLRTEMMRSNLIDGGIYMGALFFDVVAVTFNGLAELAMTIFKLPVFYKQKNLLFFPAWAYALPLWILKIPVTTIEVGVWVFITYYVMGLDPQIHRFFKQYLVLFFTNQMASALFRLAAALARDLIAATTFGSFILLILFANSGFVLSRDAIKKWWIWGYWISPMMYGQNAVAVNEFLGESWSHQFPNSTETLGVAVLKSKGFFSDAYWYWIGVGALIGFTLLFNLGNIVALTYLNALHKPQAVKSVNQSTEDDDRNKETIQTNADRGNDIGRRITLVESLFMRPETAVMITHERRRGMILPFEQQCITFEDITYSIGVPKEMKDQGLADEKLVLLKSVSGAFRPGVLTALMGVSGAGKTTLMDVLAGRKTGGYIEGKITISGYPKKQETFARISGYCEQNDIHSPHVTVYESLLYSAWLRLPPEVNSEARKMFIDEIMELIELTPLKGALVGLPGVNGLSTEQRKRLTIAVELVANPSIIFMDEPTSGLDARAAAIVMRTVRKTVDTGRTVVCTIHQPSIDIFEGFDELFLLKPGGQEIYVGPLGHHSCHLIKYFQGINGVSKIKPGYNPAAWMLDITSPGHEVALGIDFADLYKKSDLYKRNKELIKKLSTPAPGSKDLSFRTRYSKSFFSQLKVCLWKQHFSYWRNPQYTAVRFFVTIIISLMFGTMYWDLGAKRAKQQDLLNSMGSMYSAVLFLGILNSNSVQPVVTIERTVFYRERAAGMYSAMPYALAQVLIELPYAFQQALTYGVIVYTMMGFELTLIKFFWYLFYMYFTLLYFTFYGMMAVAMTPNYHIAGISSSAFYGVWNLFAGFVIPLKKIPSWWSWYYWACPVSWTLYGMLTSQYGDVKDRLDIGITVEEFLSDYFGFRHDFLGVVACAVIGFTLLFASVFAISIKLLNFQRR